MTTLTDRLAELSQMLNGHRIWCLKNQPGNHECNCDTNGATT
jgi:hypothetical protein